MLKKVMLIFIIFLLIISGFIGYQWFSYQHKKETEIVVQTEPLTYEIALSHRAEGLLHVEQKVINLEQDAFFMKVPFALNDFSCTYINNEECVIESEDEVEKVLTNGHNNLTLEYTIPIDLVQSARLFEKWFFQFLNFNKEPILSDFKVTVSEELDKSILWAAGAMNKATLEKEHLMFYAWEKKNTITFPLYLSNLPYKRENVLDRLVLFAGETSQSSNLEDVVQHLPVNTGVSIVHLGEAESKVTPLLAIVNKNESQEAVEEYLIHAALLHLSSPKNENIEWLWSSLPTVFLDRVTGEKKAFEISRELKNNLTPEMRNSFMDWLIRENQGEAIGTEDLDGALISLFGHKTQFFQKNSQVDTPLVPLYFIDERNIYIGQESKRVDWNAIIRENEILLPLDQVASSFDFEVTEISKDETYLVNRGMNSWRLFLNEKYFIYNEENYGITAEPLKKIDGQIYMTEQFFEDLLKIEVVKRDDGIYLRK